MVRFSGGVFILAAVMDAGEDHGHGWPFKKKAGSVIASNLLPASHDGIGFAQRPSRVADFLTVGKKTTDHGHSRGRRSSGVGRACGPFRNYWMASSIP